MTRQAFVLADQATVVFWTPKAACTTIARLVSDHALRAGHRRPARRRIGTRHWLARLGYRLSGQAAADLCRSRGFASLCLLRDPYDRLVSAYIHKFVHDGTRPKAGFTTLVPFAAEFYRAHVRPRTGGSTGYAGLSFREFAEAICDIIDARGSDEPDLDHHFNTQVPFAFAEQRFRYDSVHRLDAAEGFFERLCALTGSTPHVPHLNRTPRSSNGPALLTDHSSRELCRLPGFDRAAFRDPDLEARIARSFALDYDYLALAQADPHSR